MDRIIQGVLHFQEEVFPTLKHHFRLLADRQNPQALFLTCADSRIVPQLMTQTEPGDLFISRNVGNMVPAYGNAEGGVIATIEYSVEVLGVKHIIVCGHSDCGAMKGVLHPERVASMPAVARWLRYGEVARRIVQEAHPGASESDLLLRLAEQNVVAQLAHLRTHPSVAIAQTRGDLALHGWMYHISTGRVELFDEAAGRFRPLARSETTAPPPPAVVPEVA